MISFRRFEGNGKNPSPRRNRSDANGGADDFETRGRRDFWPCSAA